MTFEEIYTKAIDEIKQDPVSYVWNNYIKKHDDQEFIVITKPKMEDGKYPKYFLECLYILRLDISEIKYGTSTDAILLQNHNVAKRWYSQNHCPLWLQTVKSNQRESNSHQRL